MNLQLFEIVSAIVMVGVAFALFLAIRRYMATASERRMMGMLERIGLDPATVSSADQGAIIKEVRQRCRHCASEDVCERWLAGSQPGENDFCPNAKVFEALKRTIGATG